MLDADEYSDTYEPIIDIDYYDCTHSAGENGPSTTTGFFFATRFEGCYIEDARLEDCMFVNVQFIDCTFLDVLWADIYLKDVKFTGCTFQRDLWRMDKWVGRSLEDELFEDHTQLGKVIPAEITDARWLKDQRTALTTPHKVLQMKADFDLAVELQEEDDLQGVKSRKRGKRARGLIKTVTAFSTPQEVADGTVVAIEATREESDKEPASDTPHMKGNIWSAWICANQLDDDATTSLKATPSSDEANGESKVAVAASHEETDHELAKSLQEEEYHRSAESPKGVTGQLADSATIPSSLQEEANRECDLGLQALKIDTAMHSHSPSSAAATTDAPITSGSQLREAQRERLNGSVSTVQTVKPVAKGAVVDVGDSAADQGQRIQQLATSSITQDPPVGAVQPIAQHIQSGDGVEEEPQSPQLQINDVAADSMGQGSDGGEDSDDEDWVLMNS